MPVNLENWRREDENNKIKNDVSKMGIANRKEKIEPNLDRKFKIIFSIQARTLCSTLVKLRQDALIGTKSFKETLVLGSPRRRTWKSGLRVFNSITSSFKVLVGNAVWKENERLFQQG